jgi:glycosyltransferase involved in cell wall biosynthesis
MEDDVLSRLHIGLYPVDETHPLAEGKCGLKAVLYLAHGVPVVTTPTTTNAVIVRDGVEGLHAREPADWSNAVSRLLADPELRERLRRNGWQRVRDEYSLAVWGPRVAAALRTVAEGAA